MLWYFYRAVPCLCFNCNRTLIIVSTTNRHYNAAMTNLDIVLCVITLCRNTVIATYHTYTHIVVLSLFGQLPIYPESTNSLKLQKIYRMTFPCNYKQQ